MQTTTTTTQFLQQFCHKIIAPTRLENLQMVVQNNRFFQVVPQICREAVERITFVNPLRNSTLRVCPRWHTVTMYGSLITLFGMRERPRRLAVLLKIIRPSPLRAGPYHSGIGLGHAVFLRPFIEMQNSSLFSLCRQMPT